MRNGWFAALVVAALLPGFVAQAEEEGSSSGPPTPARPQGSTLSLRMPDGTVFAETKAGLPYVDLYSGPVMAPNEALTVRFAPGEALADSKFVRIAAADGAFAGGDAPAALLKGAPAGTVVITYVQEAGSVGMILRIDHNLGRAIAYDVEVEHFRDGRWKAEPASACVVRAGEPTVRRWPDPTKRIFFHRFHYAADAELNAGCP